MDFRDITLLYNFFMMANVEDVLWYLSNGLMTSYFRKDNLFRISCLMHFVNIYITEKIYFVYHTIFYFDLNATAFCTRNIRIWEYSFSIILKSKMICSQSRVSIKNEQCIIETWTVNNLINGQQISSPLCLAVPFLIFELYQTK